MRDGDPTWHFLGGRPSLDLVNTVRERWRRSIETLRTPLDLADWLVAAEISAQRPAVTEAVLAEAVVLREAIDAVVRALAARGPVDPAAITAIDDVLVFAGARPQLRLGADGAPELGERAPADSARRALGMIALDAAELLGRPGERARLRICSGDECSAAFYDRSPAGRRQWCSMEVCGNRAKARRHRARQATA